MNKSILNRYTKARTAALGALKAELTHFSKSEPLMRAIGNMFGSTTTVAAETFRNGRFRDLEVDFNRERVQCSVLMPKRSGRINQKWFMFPLAIFTNDRALRAWMQEQIAAGTKAVRYFEEEDYGELRRLQRRFDRLPKARQQELMAPKPKKQPGPAPAAIN